VNERWRFFADIGEDMGEDVANLRLSACLSVVTAEPIMGR
jgi:hypothetical protein